MGQVEESMTHFYRALRLLQYKLPRSLVGGSFALVQQSIKQFFHYKLPSNGSISLNREEPFLERARCLAHISHSYRLQKRNIMGLMTSLKRLNDAEKAQEYHVHEVSIAVGLKCINLPAHTHTGNGGICWYDRTLSTTALR